jgi:hypothetical protein
VLRQELSRRALSGHNSLSGKATLVDEVAAVTVQQLILSGLRRDRLRHRHHVNLVQVLDEPSE